MTAYADYNFYCDEYLCGKEAPISADDFAYYAQKATAIIRQHTFGNIGEEIPRAVIFCCCELAEQLHSLSANRLGVSSEKVGDISKTYESAEAQNKTAIREQKRIINSWLADTGLLYRGGRLC